MKVLALIGSPRKNGSTDRLVREVVSGMEYTGAETRVYYLNDLQIGGCQSCHQCTKTNEVVCVQNDDINPLLKEIEGADIVVFGTPIYMASMSGQMKLMLDRMYPFIRSDNSSKMGQGKKAVWVVTQRNPDETRYKYVLDTLKFPMKMLGFFDCDFYIIGGTSSSDDLLKKEDILKQAYAFGKERIG